MGHKITARIAEDRRDLETATKELRQRLDTTGLRYHHYATTAGPTSIVYEIDFDVSAPTRDEARKRIREALNTEANLTVHH
jgi:hypothetical protein